MSEETTSPPSDASGSRAQAPTPVLDQFGRDLTRWAAEGRLGPVVGREAEVELVVETLARRTRRNPLLVGPPGAGKGAVVEGLARRIVAGDVPEALRGARLVALQPSVLVAGVPDLPAFLQRVAAVVVEASQGGVILAIEEASALIGVGGRSGAAEASALLKPALARGELTCIASATEAEYRGAIEPDGALAWWFQPIRVPELTAEQTLAVLRGLRDGSQGAEGVRGVRVGDDVLRWLVDFAARYLRNRAFPDKAIDLLDQCVAHALVAGRREVTLADAEAVVRRMVGAPAGLAERLGLLRERLPAAAPLPPDDVARLHDRLAVTGRGLDVNPARPDAVALLVGPATAYADELAALLAEALSGARERVVAVDFGQFVGDAAVAMLLGGPGGGPFEPVAEMPWCVVLCRNVHACHPRAREVLAQALAAGYLTDARGRRIYFSDTAVLLTAGVAAPRPPLGFVPPGGEGTAAERAERAWRASAEAALGGELVAQCDVLFSELAETGDARARWVQERLLADLAARCRPRGVELRWDDAAVRWLLDEHERRVRGARETGEAGELAGDASWERLVDERLAPLLIPHLPETPPVEPKVVELSGAGGELRATAVGAARADRPSGDAEP